MAGARWRGTCRNWIRNLTQSLVKTPLVTSDGRLGGREEDPGVRGRGQAGWVSRTVAVSELGAHLCPQLLQRLRKEDCHEFKDSCGHTYTVRTRPKFKIFLLGFFFHRVICSLRGFQTQGNPPASASQVLR